MVENLKITGAFAGKGSSRNFNKLRKEGKDCKEKKREKIGKKQEVPTKKEKPPRKARPKVRMKEEQGQHR